jgi:TonB family protein
VLPYTMLYTVAVGAPIALAAWSLGSALRRYGRPERGVWLVGLALAFVIPLAGLILSRSSTDSVRETARPDVVGLPELLVVPADAAPVSAESYLVSLWILLSGFLALRWAWGTYRLHVASRHWTFGSIDGVDVSVTEDVGPAVAGVFRTRILTPSWVAVLPEEKRSLVIMHEQEHIRARDPFVVMIARIARVLVPWNPVVWVLSTRLVRAIELDCDRRVLRRTSDVAAYGTTLLDISARRPSRLLAAAAFAESEAPLRSRILAMTTPPRAVSIAAIMASVVLGVVLLVGALEIPVPAIRVQVEIGQTPPAPAEAAITPPFEPSSTRPRLLNEEEVRVVAELELERLIGTPAADHHAPTSVPKFTPVSVQPSLLNRQDVGRVLAEDYPKELRDAGIGGTVTLGLRVGPEGTVVERSVERSSGHEPLDEAALGVTDVMRFEPARNRDQRVPVWVSLPVTFTANP